MQSLQAVDALQDRLAGEIGWRKKEIVAFRTAAARSSSSQGYYARAGTVMLCAHWEGFLKAALQAYVDHVFAQKLGLRQLAPPFVAIYFYKHVKNASAAKFPGSEGHHIKLARKISESIDAPCRSGGWAVDTDGNPSSAVVSSVLSSVGLDSKLAFDEVEWSVFKVFIDAQIVNERHKVAHGERYPIPGDTFREKSNRIISICERLSRLVIEAADARAYMVVPLTQ